MRLLYILMLLCTIAPLTLSVSLSTDRPQPGEDVMATVVVFDGAGDVQVELGLPAGVELAAPVPTLHANPVGLAVVRLHVRSDAAVGVRTLVFRAGGRVVERQVYVGVFAWARATFGMKRWLPIVRR